MMVKLKALSLFLAVLQIYVTVISARESCLLREFGPSKYVCVCNEEHCDTLDNHPEGLEQGTVRVYHSSQSGLRMEDGKISFRQGGKGPDVEGTTVEVNVADRYQEVLGFGGSFTDASGINIRKLPQKMQDDLIEAYYGKSGLEYTIGRAPMASCDFSTHPYSYCDHPDDFELKNFALTQEDLELKIPFIQQAQKLTESRGQQLLMFASPWSSPDWMKTNNKMNESGVLKGEVGGQYYQTWADYFVRFLQEYDKHDITFWGLTAENEPTNGFVKNFEFQCLGFTAETQRDFIKINLGPTLKKAGFGVDKVHLMIHDDQRYNLPKWAVTVLSDPEAAKYVTGVAFHWYGNSLSPPKVLDQTHEQLPGYFLLATEACEGAWPWDKGVDLGSWKRAETYAFSIIEDLSHWSVGWVDWNLVLDLGGGPNWVENFVDAPIIVNEEKNEFYKQPMYYALGHFSKFIPPGSKRIGLDVKTDKNTASLDTVAFVTPEDQIVLIVLNKNDKSTILTLSDKRFGILKYSVPAHSLQTYVWRN